MLRSSLSQQVRGAGERQALTDPLEGVTPIAIDALDVDPDHPRQEALTDIEALADSILHYGLLQPVVVEAPRNGRYVLLVGMRRLMAYRHLFATQDDHWRWGAIPAIIRDTPQADRLVLSLIENVARQELSEGEVMTALCVLREVNKWGPSELGRRLGVTRQWIHQYFSIADDPTLSQYVQAGQLTVAKAQDVRLARTRDARTAALDAALEGAPLRRIRELARPAPLPDAQERVSSDFTPAVHQSMPPETELRVTSMGARGLPESLPGAPAAQSSGPVAAQSHAGAVDARLIAEKLGMVTHLREYQLAKMLLSASQRGTDQVEMATLIGVLRADLAAAEAKVQAAYQRR